MTTMGIRTTMREGFDDARSRVTEALKSEGFGVLTEVDVQSTLKQKLGVEMRRYAILGACNPPFAHQAIGIDPDAGLMMPCNVVIREGDDGGVTVVAVDPTQSAQATGSAQLVELAGAVKEKLQRALAKLA